jgi:hypothetical protein
LRKPRNRAETLRHVQPERPPGGMAVCANKAGRSLKRCLLAI